MKNLAVIIVAGGRGNRMGGAFPKQFMNLGDKPMLMRTIERFHKTCPASNIIVALHIDYIEYWHGLCKEYGFDVPHGVCPGGISRFHSVQNALALIGNPDLVAIHDGVRPLVSSELIERAVNDARTFGAVIPVVSPVDSMRKVADEGSKIVKREQYRMVQTPQVFKTDIITRAYRQEFSDKYTDDASVVGYDGGDIYLCEGDVSNIKVTTPVDLVMAEALLQYQMNLEAEAEYAG